MDIALESRARTWKWHPGGALALAGGMLIAGGALLPWLSVFEGLKTIRGVEGLNGRILLVGGAVTAVGGAVSLVRGGRRLDVALGILGALLASFAGYLVAQLLGTMHGLDGMLLARMGPGLFVSAAGSMLVVGTVFASDGTAVSHPRPERSSARVLAGIVALASAGAGIVHFAVAPGHLREFPIFGVFFIVTGIAQLAWAARVWIQPTRGTLVVGAAANALIVVLWIVSRTAGLPIGPEHWTPETAGFADIVCSAYEGLIVLGAVMLLRRRDRELGAVSSFVGRSVPVAVGVPLTVGAILAGTGVLSPAAMHM